MFNIQNEVGLSTPHTHDVGFNNTRELLSNQRLLWASSSTPTGLVMSGAVLEVWGAPIRCFCGSLAPPTLVLWRDEVRCSIWRKYNTCTALLSATIILSGDGTTLSGTRTSLLGASTSLLSASTSLLDASTSLLGASHLYLELVQF